MTRRLVIVGLVLLVLVIDGLLRAALDELEVAERARDELRSRLQHFGPVWRRRDWDWDGALW